MIMISPPAALQRSGKFSNGTSQLSEGGGGAPLLFSCASRKSLGVEMEVEVEVEAILRLPRIYFEQLYWRYCVAG